VATSKVIDISSNDTVTRQQRRALERAEEKKHTYLMSAPSRGEIQQYVTGVFNQVLPPIANEVQGNTLALELLAEYLGTVLPSFKLADLQAFVATRMAEMQKAGQPESTGASGGLSGAAQPVCNRQESQEEPLTIPVPQGSIVLTD